MRVSCWLAFDCVCRCCSVCVVRRLMFVARVALVVVSCVLVVVWCVCCLLCVRS